MDRELEDGLDRMEMAERTALMATYGHSYGMAALLARYSRDLQRESLEKPLPMCIVTGI